MSTTPSRRIPGSPNPSLTLIAAAEGSGAQGTTTQAPTTSGAEGDLEASGDAGSRASGEVGETGPLDGITNLLMKERQHQAEVNAQLMRTGQEQAELNARLMAQLQSLQTKLSQRESRKRTGSRQPARRRLPIGSEHDLSDWSSMTSQPGDPPYTLSPITSTVFATARQRRRDMREEHDPHAEYPDLKREMATCMERLVAEVRQQQAERLQGKA